MKRRTFIKNSIPLAFSPLFVESIIRQKVSKMFGIDNAPSGFEDRKLLIINLFGGNDGLNTVIPLNSDQHDTYIRHRNKIGLRVPLDLGTTGDLSLGLHPIMTEFKTLYGEGKLNIIQSVGYPEPNFSHFRSDSLIFGGLDGTHPGVINKGWMANYLANVYPSYNDQPTSQYPNPLGVQIGYGSQHNGFIHEAYNNLGININGINGWNPDAGRFSDSEKKILIQYLRLIKEGRQVYRRNLKSVYDNGTDELEDYPESNLGRQLKTLAKMISGGLTSKILLARHTGYDTHSNQLENHQNILRDLSKSIFAFQKDMENQEFDDKIIIIVMSEFGRQILENIPELESDDLPGTDHGTLSPWFVIGTPIKGKGPEDTEEAKNRGITGRNIDLNAVSGRHTTDILQHDYRRILSTIIQDWFGHTDPVLNQTGLGEFNGEIGTEHGKLDILEDDQVLTGEDLVPNFNVPFTDILNPLAKIKEENGWTYYVRPGTTVTYFFAIEHFPEGEGANTQDFEPLITITDLLNDGVGRDYYEKIITEPTNRANFVLGKTWSIVIGSGSTDGFVNMRFFISPSRLARLDQLATDFKNTTGGTKSNALWIKTTDSLLNPETDFNELGATKGIESVGLVTQSAFETQSYYQFENVTDFDNRGGAILQVVTNELLGFEENENPGTIILTESGKLYGYNGTEWRILFSQ